jgi:ribosome recycling factor
VQQHTDKKIIVIDAVCATKEKELMTV